MAYVNVAEWSPEHVSDWLKGLDDEIQPYTQFFVNNNINGCHLLTLCRDDLANLNIIKVGHHELVLEAVELLKQLHYNLTSETLQSLALKLGCKAQSLFNQLKHVCQDFSDSGKKERVSTETLSAVSDILNLVKSLISWLDRYPFAGQEKYVNVRKAVLKLSVELASTAQRDQFAEMPHKVIKDICQNLSSQSDRIVQEFNDSLIIQPAILEVAKVKRKAEDNVGVHINSSYTGIHIIDSIKFQSPAYRCGKIEDGDEIIQVNYQTVVGWQVKNILCALKEHPSEVHLTLKKRPRHPNVLGQVITLWPYRIPSKKTAFRKFYKFNKGKAALDIRDVCPKSPDPRCDINSVSENYCIPIHDKERQLYFGKSRNRVRRRATITGISPTALQPLIYLDDLIGNNVKKKQSVGRAASYDPGRVGNVDDSVFKDDMPSENSSRQNAEMNMEKKPVVAQKSQFLQPPTDKYLAGCLRRQQPVTEISPQNEVSGIKLLVDFSKAANNNDKKTHSSLSEPPQTTVTVAKPTRSSTSGLPARPATNGGENLGTSENYGSNVIEYCLKDSRPTLSEIRAMKKASDAKNPNEKVGTHARKNTLPRQPFLHKRNILQQQNRSGSNCVKYSKHEENKLGQRNDYQPTQRRPMPQMYKKSEFMTPSFSRFPYEMHESKIVSLKSKLNLNKLPQSQPAKISYVPNMMVNGVPKAFIPRPQVPQQLDPRVHNNSNFAPKNIQNGKKMSQALMFNPVFGRSRSYNDIAFSSDDSSVDDSEDEEDEKYEEICNKPNRVFVQNSNQGLNSQQFHPGVNKHFAAKVAEVYYMLNQGHCFPTPPNNRQRTNFDPASSAIIDELAKQMYHALRNDHSVNQKFSASTHNRSHQTQQNAPSYNSESFNNYRCNPKSTVHSKQFASREKFYQQYPVYSDLQEEGNTDETVWEKPVDLSPPTFGVNKNPSFKSATSQEIHNLYTSGMNNKPQNGVERQSSFGKQNTKDTYGQSVFEERTPVYESLQFFQEDMPQYRHYVPSNTSMHLGHCNQSVMFCPAERESDSMQCNDQVISTPSDGWKYFDKGVFYPIKEEECPIAEELGHCDLSNGHHKEESKFTKDSQIKTTPVKEEPKDNNFVEKSVFTFEKKKAPISITTLMSNMPKPPEDDFCHERIKSSSSQTDVEPNNSGFPVTEISLKTYVSNDEMLNLGNDESFLDCMADTENCSFSNCSSSSSLNGSVSSSTISSTNSYYLVEARTRPKIKTVMTDNKNDAVSSSTSTRVPMLKKRTPNSGGSDSGCHSESHSHHLSIEDLSGAVTETSEVFRSPGIITDNTLFNIWKC